MEKNKPAAEGFSQRRYHDHGLDCDEILNMKRGIERLPWNRLLPVVLALTCGCAGKTARGASEQSVSAPDAPVRVVSVEKADDYNALFRARPEGWLGADGIYSVPLSPSKTVWLFGDTLIGAISQGRRRMDAFINNSIAIESRVPGQASKVEFFWDSSSKPAGSFFPHQSGTSGAFYWPVTGVLLDGELFVFCYPVRTSQAWFDISDTTVIRIPAPHESPRLWKQAAYDLGLGNSHQGFISAAVIKEPYVYFLGYDDPDNDAAKRRMVLARALKTGLLAGGRREIFEFWVLNKSGPTWSREPKGLVTLFSPGVTETQVQYDASLGLYICPFKRDGSPDIQLTAAPELTGPWSKPVQIYRIAEHDVSFGIMSYAIKAHPELASAPGELVISYATNTPDSLDPLFTPEGLGIYVPLFIRVKLAKTGVR
ncbi:MAG: hypothetical protein ABIG11_01465 [bacterium]